MMKYLLLMLLLFLYAISSAQVKKIWVIDRGSSKVVPYATVKVLHKPFGGMTSQYGQIELKLNDGDSILITCIGYKKLFFVWNPIVDTLRITVASVPLDTVTISAQTLIGSFVIGNGAGLISKKIKCDFTPGKRNECERWTGTRGTEFVELMTLPDSLRTFRLGIAYLPIESVECWRPIFLNVYEYDAATGLPGELLFQRLLTMQSENYVKGKAIIDLRGEQILFKKVRHFFIGISWLEGNLEHDCITGLVFLKRKSDVTYSRTYLDPSYKWFKFGGKRVGMEDTEGQFQTIFAVKVEAIKD
jgi:hypothetical protein